MLENLQAVPDLESIEATLLEIVAGVAGCPAAEIGRDSLMDDLGIDSLLIVEVVIAAQRRFGIQVPPAEFRGDIRTVGEVCDAIGAYVHEQLAIQVGEPV